MELRKAQRSSARIKMGLQGPSGSGKTMSSLLLAFGLCGNWEKIAVIDSENNSADLYADLGPYQVIPLSAPFTSEKYITAINICINEGIDVIIIDSITHQWENLLEQHSSMAGNSYTNWNRITPIHNSFLQAILQAPVHVIVTIRSKQDYILVEKNGKMVPEKVGMKGISREGTEYEFTLILELDIKNHASASKDRTGLFMNKPQFKISKKTGEIIEAWCNRGKEGKEGKEGKVESDFIEKINCCKTIDELLDLYKNNPDQQQVCMQQFTSRRQQILPVINNIDHT